MAATPNPTRKVVMMGDANVGKTCIVHRLMRSEFLECPHPTISAMTHTVKLPGQDREVSMRIWDTAGQEQYRSLVQVYFQDSVAAVLTIDITDSDPYPSIEEWTNRFRDSVGPKPLMIIAANKVDLITDPSQVDNVVSAISETTGLTTFAVSAKTGEGISNMFGHIAHNIDQVGEPEKQPLEEAPPSKCSC